MTGRIKRVFSSHTSSAILFSDVPWKVRTKTGRNFYTLKCDVEYWAKIASREEIKGSLAGVYETGCLFAGKTPTAPLASLPQIPMCLFVCLFAELWISCGPRLCVNFSSSLRLLERKCSVYKTGGKTSSLQRLRVTYTELERGLSITYRRETLNKITISLLINRARET